MLMESAGAISKAVSRLESSLGAPLLVRSSKAARMSDDGLKLFERTSHLFEAVEEAIDKARETTNHITGVVQLSTFTVFGRVHLAPILPAFLEAYPGVDLLVSFHDSQKGLSRDNYDIRITWGERLDDDKIAHVLCGLPLIMVASPSYLAAKGIPQRPEDLAGHDCINGLLASGTRARWSFRAPDGSSFDINPRGRIVLTNEMGIVADLARRGLGLTLIHPDDVGDDIREGTLVRVLGDYAIGTNDALQSQAVMQYRRRVQLSSAAKALVDFLIAHVRDKA
jgi:DNA-binding transcriptional LysR family regulator